MGLTICGFTEDKGGAMDPEPFSHVIEMFVGLPEDDIINGPETFPKIGLDCPWEYNGWKIWKWTGWKGNWFRRSYKSPTVHCRECGNPIEMWDIVYMAMNLQGAWHAGCYPAYQGTITGQWLALNWIKDLYDPDFKDTRYLYASVPGGEGEYHKGECFDIDPHGKLLTYFSDPEELEEAKWEGLERLRAVIDREVNCVAIA